MFVKENPDRRRRKKKKKINETHIFNPLFAGSRGLVDGWQSDVLKCVFHARYTLVSHLIFKFSDFSLIFASFVKNFNSKIQFVCCQVIHYILCCVAFCTILVNIFRFIGKLIWLKIYFWFLPWSVVWSHVDLLRHAGWWYISIWLAIFKLFGPFASKSFIQRIVWGLRNNLPWYLFVQHFPWSIQVYWKTSFVQNVKPL